MSTPSIAGGSVLVSVTTSLDGYLAGPGQSLERPFGDRFDEDRMHSWMFEHADENPAELAALSGGSAFVMGRNMFGPGRGDWDPEWRGWWGEEPPYHAPVFVVTHHEREPLEMEGGTTFTFVTDGVAAAVTRAKDAAGDGYVVISGGAATVNQALQAGLVDELWLHVVPVLIGAGARLLDGAPLTDLEKVEVRDTEPVTHLRYRVRR